MYHLIIVSKKYIISTFKQSLEFEELNEEDRELDNTVRLLAGLGRWSNKNTSLGKNRDEETVIGRSKVTDPVKIQVVISGFLWNARALGDPEKGFFINDIIAQHHVNFVDIQETEKRVILLSIILKISVVELLSLGFGFLQ